MILDVRPIAHLKGKLELPASKSYSIRAFMVAACGGISKIINPSDCDDALVALKIAKALGAQVQQEGNVWHVRSVRKALRNKILVFFKLLFSV